MLFFLGIQFDSKKSYLSLHRSQKRGAFFDLRYTSQLKSYRLRSYPTNLEQVMLFRDKEWTVLQVKMYD